MTYFSRSFFALFTIIATTHCAHQAAHQAPDIEERNISTQPILTHSKTEQISNTEDEDIATPLQLPTYNIDQAKKLETLPQTQQQNAQVESLLKSAEYYIQANQINKTEQLLQKINQSTSLSPIQTARKSIIEAYLAFHRADYQTSLDYLMPILSNVETKFNEHRQSTKPAKTKLTSDLKAQEVDALLLSSFCHQKLNNNELAILALLRRSDYLNGTARAENERYTWSVINQLTISQRQTLIQTTTNHSIRNQLQSSLEGQYSNTSTPIANLHQLPSQHLLPAIQSDWKQQSAGHIAVLLPLSSRFKKSAMAVKDGIEFIHKQNTSPYKPIINFIDIGHDPDNISLYYFQALNSGADAIIGPIGKDYANRLHALLEQEDNTQTAKTVILLSGDFTINKQLTPWLFRLSMGVNQQADIAAAEALRKGYINAAILAPNTPYGQKLSEAFSRRWLSVGGNLKQNTYYSNDNVDHSFELKSLFKIQQSEQRHKQLNDALGIKSKFSAHRRTDIDFIYLIANNNTGRLIRPQINFYSGKTLPVMANIDIYNGIEDKANNLDLDQTHFPVMPWVITSKDSSPYAGKLNMLFAMGADTYFLTGHLSSSHSQKTAINGLTGQLHLNSSGHIKHQPMWANFIEGKIEPIDAYLPLFNYSSKTQQTAVFNAAPSTSSHSNKNHQQGAIYDNDSWDARNNRRKTGN